MRSQINLIRAADARSRHSLGEQNGGYARAQTLATHFSQ
jgi:hypothetical protein